LDPLQKLLITDVSKTLPEYLPIEVETPNKDEKPRFFHVPSPETVNSSSGFPTSLLDFFS